MAARTRSRSGALNVSIAIRRGGAGDRAYLLDLGRRTVDDSLSALRRSTPALVRANYERLVEFAYEQSHLVFVAESELGERLGFLLLLDSLPDEVSGLPQAFVAYMAVEPHARRGGVGARLLAAAEDAARGRGLGFMALMVTEDNDAARELYAQAGYTTERRLLCKPL